VAFAARAYGRGRRTGYEMATTANKLIVVAAALYAGSLTFAHADQQFEDCRTAAGYIAVQNYHLAHPGNASNYPHMFLALLQAMRADNPSMSLADVLANCGFKNPRRVLSLLKSDADMARQQVPDPRSMTCDPNGFGGMDCDEE
jgi:hypothetical protein